MRLLLGDARAALIMTEDTTESLVRALEAAGRTPLPHWVEDTDVAIWKVAHKKLKGALDDNRDKW